MLKPATHLSRRERQIMDSVYRRGKASAAQVMEDIPSPPTYSGVRALLRILEEKGLLTHVQEGYHYIFSPTQPHQSAAKSAISQVIDTFFAGSVETAVATLISQSETPLSDEEYDRLEELIKQARNSNTTSDDNSGGGND